MNITIIAETGGNRLHGVTSQLVGAANNWAEQSHCCALEE